MLRNLLLPRRVRSDVGIRAILGRYPHTPAYRAWVYLATGYRY